ncbi:hypothetical protein X975_27197, partial [Stegodyphus mimosarum]
MRIGGRKHCGYIFLPTPSLLPQIIRPTYSNTQKSGPKFQLFNFRAPTETFRYRE